MAECRSCSAVIDWARDSDGKAVPVDRASAGQPGGTLAVRRDGQGHLRVRYLKGSETPDGDEKHGVSHFATCPQAGQWRGKAKADG